MSKPYVPQDRYAKMARFNNYRARSVYKLEEIDRKFHIIKKNMRVLDLAAAPGSWMQYTSQKVGPIGYVLGLDLTPIEPVAENTRTSICDITDMKAVGNEMYTLGWEHVDLILSDIAPSTTGIADIDHGRSIELNTAIFELSKKYLKPGGKLVMKVFEGRTFQDFMKELKKYYTHVFATKVHATRERSHEMYVICY